MKLPFSPSKSVHSSENREESAPQSHSPRSLVGWIVIAILVLGVDASLIMRSAGSGLAGVCGAECDSVLKSSFGHVLGIPLGYLAMAAHLALTALFFSRKNRLARMLALPLAGSVLGAALCLVAVQAFVIGEWCVWCNSAHMLGLALAGWLVWSYGWTKKGGWAGALSAAATACVLVVFSGTDREAEVLNQRVEQVVTRSDGRILLHGGRFSLDPSELPHAGNLAAAQVVIALTDYTCPHCKRVHGALSDVLESAPDQMGVVWLPAYRNELSGKIQGYMLALFRANPEAHASLSADLWSGRVELTEQAVKSEIARLMKGEIARVEAHLPWVEKMLATTREIVLANKETVATSDLPQLMLNDQILVGDGGETGKLASLLRKELMLSEAQAPMLSLQNSEFDIGAVRTGEAVEVVVTFKNSGSATLRVEGFQDEVTQRAALGQEGKWAPGQTGEVRVVVPAPQKDGPFEVKMHLLTNAPKKVFTVKGNAVTTWRLSESKIDFGTWTEGASAPAPKTVRLSFEKPSTIGVPFVAGAAFGGTAAVVEAQRSFDLTVTPPADLPKGTHSLTVSVPVRPGIDLSTGEELPLAPGVPSTVNIPLTIQRL